MTRSREKAQATLRECSRQSTARGTSSLHAARRPKHVFSGMITCAICKGTIGNAGRDYLVCTTASKKATCRNVKSIRRGNLEEVVLRALATQLMAPDLVAEFVRAFTAEWNREVAEDQAGRATDERALKKVEKSIAGLLSAIIDGLRGPDLQSMLDKLSAEKADLMAQIAAPPSKLPSIHPNLPNLYREKVSALQKALHDDPHNAEAAAAVRALAEKVIVHPATEGRGIQIELVGKLSEMLAIGAGFMPKSRVDLICSIVR